MPRDIQLYSIPSVAPRLQVNNTAIFGRPPVARAVGVQAIRLGPATVTF